MHKRLKAFSQCFSLPQHHILRSTGSSGWNQVWHKHGDWTSDYSICYTGFVSGHAYWFLSQPSSRPFAVKGLKQDLLIKNLMRWAEKHERCLISWVRVGRNLFVFVFFLLSLLLRRIRMVQVCQNATSNWTKSDCKETHKYITSKFRNKGI